METSTRLASVGDLDRAANVLGDAFADSPWTRWTVEASEHERRIVALQRLAMEHFALPFGAVSVTTVDGEIHSVAAWSDSAAISAATFDAGIATEAAALEGIRHQLAQAAERQLDPHRPSHRHLYLGVVGTRRSMQGRGLAGRTLAPLFRSSEHAGLDVCLETSTESNVAFYRRLGFELDTHVVIDGGGPEVWLMRREPSAH